MELRVLGAAFINQIRTPAQSLGVKVSQSKKQDDGLDIALLFQKILKW